MAEKPRFLEACRLRPADRTPIWIMRQAGRYLPEYREIRKDHGLLEICRSPELACEVALQPLRRFDLDAAILFSDLLIPVEALGIPFEIVEERGPVLERPIRDQDAVRALKVPADLERIDFVFETIRLIRGAVASPPFTGRRVPVIGFAGAPFTIASYLIEGGPTREFRETKLMMYRQPELFGDLMLLLADLIVACVEAQVAAGAEAIQIFDSWAGSLSPSDYRRHVLAPTRRVFDECSSCRVPLIHFGTNTGTLLDLMAGAGGDVLSVDWRIPLGDVRRRHPGRGVQGNLDPAALLAPPDVLDRMVDEVLAEAGPEPGHVFNLGHGILPETPIENVSFLVEAVHQKTRRV
ncbi:MAG TPA: uroporphyrinogen decarboxylase [Candidatus Polarisedimenticolia bacterium]